MDDWNQDQDRMDLMAKQDYFVGWCYGLPTGMHVLAAAQQQRVRVDSLEPLPTRMGLSYRFRYRWLYSRARGALRFYPTWCLGSAGVPAFLRHSSCLCRACVEGRAQRSLFCALYGVAVADMLGG